MFIASNPPMGAVINYWVGEYTSDEVSISISAPGAPGSGYVVKTLTGAGRPGFNRVVWDLQPEKEQRLGNPDDLPEFVAPGLYEVTASYGDHTQETTVEVLPAPP